MEGVHRYEGTVNKVLGDGMMALFGAPIAHEDHAARACYAGLAIQEGVSRIAEKILRDTGAWVKVRVGLHSGEVVVGSIGNDLSMDYDAIGPTVHLAARMEQLAVPGTVQVTAETLRLAERFVHAKALGPVEVKGMPEPVTVYELMGATPDRSHLEASVARGLTPFVGRAEALAALEEAIGRAGEGRGQIVAAGGQAGVGKSRLLWEVTRSHRGRGWLLIESGAVSHGRSTAYLVFRNLLRGYFQIAGGDDARAARKKVAGRLAALDGELAPHLPALLALLSLPAEDPEWEGLDPPGRRRRMIEAVTRLLLKESEGRALLVVLEDLQWSDSESLSLLESLAEEIEGARILLLISHRPEYEPPWEGREHFTALPLEPLPPAGAEDLLHGLLGADAGLAPLKRLLIERTGGNPFFLEECVQTLIEGGELGGEKGACIMLKPVESVRMPPTVQAVLAARIDRLSLDAKHLLQTASVIGKDVPLALLQTAAEEEEEEALRRDLAALIEGEFLFERTLHPAPEYAFKHILTQEVAYGGLLRERKREIHARVLEAMEALGEDGAEEQVERLAHHAFGGEAWEKAYAYFRRAGAWAASHSANREAVSCFGGALEALPHLPEGRESSERAIDLRFDLRNSLLPLGEMDRLLGRLEEAREGAEALGDSPRLSRALAFLAQHHTLSENLPRAVECGERALDIAQEAGDLDLEVGANFFLSQARQALGDYRRAAELLRKNVASIPEERRRERFGLANSASLISRSQLASCLAETGEFEEGIARGEEALRIAAEVDQPYSMISSYFGVGFLHLRKGDFDEAVSMLERCLDLSREIPVFAPWSAAYLGYAYALSGRVDEGLALLERAVEEWIRLQGGIGHSLGMAWLGEACMLAGHREEALRLARRALELCRERKEVGSQAWVHRLMGELAGREEPPDSETAESHFRQALSLAEARGMRTLLAQCRLGLGMLFGRTGRGEESREELSAAIEMFRAMGMPLDLARAEAALEEGE
ncbi:MAG: tetratricopeptide repeat protein, partial [bacterium]